MAFTVGEGNTQLLNFILEDYLVPGSHLGATDAICYIPVFKSVDDHNTDTWYFGNLFLENYYTVFDMTPSTEHN